MSPQRIRTWAARLAAPLAFFAAATVLVLVVQQGLEAQEGNPGVGTTATGGGIATEPVGETATEPRRIRRYRVRPGDTLESIAARFDTTADTLIDLNPGIDPLALNPGERIRVPRRD